MLAAFDGVRLVHHTGELLALRRRHAEPRHHGGALPRHLGPRLGELLLQGVQLHEELRRPVGLIEAPLSVRRLGVALGVV